MAWNPWLKHRIGLAILLAFVGFLAFPLFRGFQNRGRYYAAPARIDYHYQFTGVSSKYILPLGPEKKFLWPMDVENRSHSVLLKARVNGGTNLLGPVRTRASYRGEHLDNYFEPRTRHAVRYLNLSSFTGIRKNEPVELSGNVEPLADDKIELLFFKNPDLEDSRILILAPHPDDAEIASFGLYSSFSENIRILTITAGDAGWDRFGPLWPEDKKVSMRMKGVLRTFESLTVPMLAGVKPDRLRNLGYPAARLAQMFEKKPEAVPAAYTGYLTTDQYSLRRDKTGKPLTWKNLVEDIALELEVLRPNVVVTPHPLMDGHWDHHYATLALYEAMEDITPVLKGNFLYYTNHAILSEMYPFGPSTSEMTLAPWSSHLPFASFYSHSLSKEVRRYKVAAFDSFNAMRENRAFDYVDGREYFLRIKRLLRDMKWLYLELFVPEDTLYFRRGARPNEVFYLAPFDSSRDNARAFLTSLKPR